MSQSDRPKGTVFLLALAALTGVLGRADAAPRYQASWKAGGLAVAPTDLVPTAAQENDFWEDRFYRAGIDGPAFGLFQFEGKLVAGGAFQQAGEAISRYVTAWDGVRWSPLGIGMDAWVVCFAEYQGSLVAGGNFRIADGQTVNFIARWDGNAWLPLGGGTNGPVWALTVHEGKLVAGGLFSQAGNALAVNLAVWDGHTWSSLGVGLDQEVLALLSRPGELVVAGAFNYLDQREAHHIVSWDGSTWRTLGEGTDGQIVNLAEYQGKVIAGGYFARAGDDWAFNVAAWDGTTWSPLDQGTNRGIDRMIVHDGRLLVAGQFSHAGGRVSPAVAAWDGVSWAPVGNRLNDRADALWVWNGGLFVSGEFRRVGDGIGPSYSLDYMGELKEGSWRPVLEQRARGMNGPVYAIEYLDGQLVVGGAFTMAGSVPVNFVARWNGRSWEDMGGGFTNEVLALKSSNGVLYAGGNFAETMTGTQVGAIARWDGTAWQSMDGGFNRTVYDIEDYGGSIVVGGQMSSTGGHPANRVCYWDGDSWRSMGTGMTGTVTDLQIHKDKLYAGGSLIITDIGARYLAQWNQNRWEKVDHTFDDFVQALASHGNYLVVGGGFRTHGDQPIRSVARWDGTVWQGMGEGFNAAVNAFTLFQGRLVAVGQFEKSGVVSTHGLASWDGISWLPFGSGVTGPIPEIVGALSNGDRLVVGGSFNRAGGRVANYVSAWSPYVPAVLQTLNAVRTPRGATVTWSLEGLPGDPEFDIYREADGGPKTRLTQHALWGESVYQFNDPAPPPRGAAYWIAEIGRSGEVIWHGPAMLAGLPVNLVLAQNVPNPFSSSTRFSVDLPTQGKVSLVIHDLSGREVARVLDTALPAGTHEASWDGKNREGLEVAAGFYVARLSSAAGERSKKILKIQ